MIIDLDVLVKTDQQVPEQSSKSSISQVSIQESKKKVMGEATQI